MLRVLAGLFALWSAGYALRMAYFLFVLVRSYVWEHDPMIFAAHGPDPHPKTVTFRDMAIAATGFVLYGAIAVGIALWLRTTL